MVPTLVVFLELDGVVAFHVVNNGKLTIVGTDNGHVGSYLARIDHGTSSLSDVGIGTTHQQLLLRAGLAGALVELADSLRPVLTGLDRCMIRL